MIADVTGFYDRYELLNVFKRLYEFCNGQCYSHDDVVQIHDLGLDAVGAAEFLRRLLAMHEPSYGNPNISFSLDVEDGLEGRPATYVAAIMRYGALDLHVGSTALEALDKLIDGGASRCSGLSPSSNTPLSSRSRSPSKISP